VSTFGAARGMVCVACGLRYDDLRAGVTFVSARRDIIAIGVDAKTGRTKYGRRNGTLGFMHQRKMALWRAHVDECVSAHETATPAARRATRKAVQAMATELRAKRKAATKIASKAWWEREKAKRSSGVAKAVKPSRRR
jgi:hypothetical protein